MYDKLSLEELTESLSKSFFVFTFPGQFQLQLKNNNSKELSNFSLLQDMIFQGKFETGSGLHVYVFLYALTQIAIVLD